MDPRIWSRLPSEIILMIIRFAISACGLGTETRGYLIDTLWEKWLSVVHGNKTLYTAILMQRWSSATIKWSELIYNVEDLPNKYDSKDTIRRKLATKHLLEKSNSNGFLRSELLHRDHVVSPAQCVTTLRLSMFMGHSPKAFMPPSHRLIQNNLELVLPSMKAIKHISIEGPPSNTILNVLSRLPGIPLESFSIEPSSIEPSGIEPGLFDFKFGSYEGDPNHDIYDWTRLVNFKTLRNLSISQLTEAQYSSLCSLIRELPQLQRLNLAAQRSGFLLTSRRPSPLRALFRSRKETSHGEQVLTRLNLLSIVPSCLRELCIQDVFHVCDDLLQLPPAPSDYQLDLSSCPLETLVMQFVDLKSAKNLLSWLPNSKLRTLSFAPVIHDIQGQMLDRLNDALNISNEIIIPRKLSLQSFTLNNAWEIPPGFADKFNRYWQQHFALTDVVLGTTEIFKDNCPGPHDHSQPTGLKHVLFGCGENTNRWGSCVERLRIDPSWTAHDLDIHETDLLTCPSLQHLRILILGSDPDCQLDGFIAAQHQAIANRLARMAPPTLRYIRLCGYVYWLSSAAQDYEEEDHHRKAICIAQRFSLRAADDTEDTAKAQKSCSSWLTSEDKEFLDGIPNAHYIQNSLDLRQKDLNLHQKYLNSYWLQLYNFLIARRSA